MFACHKTCPKGPSDHRTCPKVHRATRPVPKVRLSGTLYHKIHFSEDLSLKSAHQGCHRTCPRRPLIRGLVSPDPLIRGLVPHVQHLITGPAPHVQLSGHLSSRGVGADTADGHRLPPPPEVDLTVLTDLPDDGHAVVQGHAGEETGRGAVGSRAARAVAAQTAREPQQPREAVGAVVLLQGPGAQRLALQSRQVGVAPGAEGGADAGEVVVVPHPDLLQRQAARVQLLHRLQFVQHLRQLLLLAVQHTQRARRRPHPHPRPRPRPPPRPRPSPRSRRLLVMPPPPRPPGLRGLRGGDGGEAGGGAGGGGGRRGRGGGRGVQGVQQRPVVDDEGEDNGEEACAGLELKHTQGSRA